MALKQKVDKATFDTLSDPIKEQYKANADASEYTLDLDGYEDPGELRRARDREKAAAKLEKDRADALQREKDEDLDRKTKNRGDIDTLEKSWKDKNEKLAKDKDEVISKKDKAIRKLLVDSVANEVAAEISTSPTLIRPHILARLDVNFDTEEPTTRVLDAAGKPSALTVAELKKEFVDNKEFASIIRASNASGGGAAGNQGGGATKAFKDMGDAERIEYNRRDPAGFKRDSEAAQKAARNF